MALRPDPIRAVSSAVLRRCASPPARRTLGSFQSIQCARFHNARRSRILLPEREGRWNTSSPRRWGSTGSTVQEQTATGSSTKPGENEIAARRPVLEPDNLFHSFTQSPVLEMQKRAASIRLHARCPHPDHQSSRMDGHTFFQRPDLGIGNKPPRPVDFECPYCGIPVYCCYEHWADDFESHLEICDTLRQINEDDHDLRSGRVFSEFDYSGPQMEEALINMTNWDTFLYSRDFSAVNDDRSMRQVTRLLTYPVTIGSILHELSPYNVRPGGRLTSEGLKSFSGECHGRMRNSLMLRLTWLNRGSLAVQLTPPAGWIYWRCERTPAISTPGAVIRPRGSCRVVAASKCLGTAVPHVPARQVPYGLHRSREHDEPGRRVSSSAEDRQ